MVPVSQVGITGRNRRLPGTLGSAGHIVRPTPRRSPQFSRPAFFCRSFFRALLQANSCVRQLRGFCFPGSSRTPSHKAAARFGSRSPRSSSLPFLLFSNSWRLTANLSLPSEQESLACKCLIALFRASSDLKCVKHRRVPGPYFVDYERESGLRIARP